VHTEVLHGKGVHIGLLVPRLGIREAGRYLGLEGPGGLQADIHLRGQELAAGVMDLRLLEGEPRPPLRILHRKIPGRPGNAQVDAAKGSPMQAQMPRTYSSHSQGLRRVMAASSTNRS